MAALRPIWEAGSLAPRPRLTPVTLMCRPAAAQVPSRALQPVTELPEAGGPLGERVLSAGKHIRRPPSDRLQPPERVLSRHMGKVSLCCSQILSLMGGSTAVQGPQGPA